MLGVIAASGMQYLNKGQGDVLRRIPGNTTPSFRHLLKSYQVDAIGREKEGSAIEKARLFLYIYTVHNHNSVGLGRLERLVTRVSAVEIQDYTSMYSTSFGHLATLEALGGSPCLYNYVI